MGALSGMQRSPHRALNHRLPWSSTWLRSRRQKQSGPLGSMQTGLPHSVQLTATGGSWPAYGSILCQWSGMSILMVVAVTPMLRQERSEDEAEDLPERKPGKCQYRLHQLVHHHVPLPTARRASVSPSLRSLSHRANRFIHCLIASIPPVGK